MVSNHGNAADALGPVSQQRRVNHHVVIASMGDVRSVQRNGGKTVEND